AGEAEAHHGQRRLVVACIGEALANLLLEIVAAVIGRVDDMLGPAAEGFHHLALARDAVGCGTVFGERMAPPRLGEAALEFGAGAVEEQRLDVAAARLPQFLDPFDKSRGLEAAASAVDTDRDRSCRLARFDG